VFFLRWIAPAAAKVVIAVLSVGILGAAASLGLQGVNVLGLPLRDVAAWARWKIALSTSLGPSLLVAIGAMGASIAALRTARLTIGRALSALALAGVGLSLAMSGYAATAPPQELMRPAMFLHGIGVAFWLGAWCRWRNWCRHRRMRRSPGLTDFPGWRFRRLDRCRWPGLRSLSSSSKASKRLSKPNKA
jgi:copper transport protein